MHDETVFPDHEVFRPERWLDGSILEKHDADPLEISFGFGRRYVTLHCCTGNYILTFLSVEYALESILRSI